MRKKQNTKKNTTAAIKYKMPWRIAKVKALDGYILEVSFQDKTHGFVEMKKFVSGKKAGVFAVLKKPSVFSKVFLELGVVTWPGEIDLPPDVMYDVIRAHGKWVM